MPGVAFDAAVLASGVRRVYTTGLAAVDNDPTIRLVKPIELEGGMTHGRLQGGA